MARKAQKAPPISCVLVGEDQWTILEPLNRVIPKHVEFAGLFGISPEMSDADEWFKFRCARDDITKQWIFVYFGTEEPKRVDVQQEAAPQTGGPMRSQKQPAAAAAKPYDRGVEKPSTGSKQAPGPRVWPERQTRYMRDNLEFQRLTYIRLNYFPHDVYSQAYKQLAENRHREILTLLEKMTKDNINIHNDLWNDVEDLQDGLGRYPFSHKKDPTEDDSEVQKEAHKELGRLIKDAEKKFEIETKIRDYLELNRKYKELQSKIMKARESNDYAQVSAIPTLQQQQRDLLSTMTARNIKLYGPFYDEFNGNIPPQYRHNYEEADSRMPPYI